MATSIKAKPNKSHLAHFWWSMKNFCILHNERFYEWCQAVGWVLPDISPWYSRIILGGWYAEVGVNFGGLLCVCSYAKGGNIYDDDEFHIQHILACPDRSEGQGQVNTSIIHFRTFGYAIRRVCIKNHGCWTVSYWGVYPKCQVYHHTSTRNVWHTQTTTYSGALSIQQ